MLQTCRLHLKLTKKCWMSDMSFYTFRMKARLKFLSYSNFSFKLKILCVYCIVSVETNFNLSAEINDRRLPLVSADFYGRERAKQ